MALSFDPFTFVLARGPAGYLASSFEDVNGDSPDYGSDDDGIYSGDAGSDSDDPDDGNLDDGGYDGDDLTSTVGSSMESTSTSTSASSSSTTAFSIPRSSSRGSSSAVSSAAGPYTFALADTPAAYHTLTPGAGTSSSSTPVETAPSSSTLVGTRSSAVSIIEIVSISTQISTVTFVPSSSATALSASTHLPSTSASSSVQVPVFSTPVSVSAAPAQTSGPVSAVSCVHCELQTRSPSCADLLRTLQRCHRRRSRRRRHGPRRAILPLHTRAAVATPQDRRRRLRKVRKVVRRHLQGAHQAQVCERAAHDTGARAHRGRRDGLDASAPGGVAGGTRLGVAALPVANRA
jgi:hypothetical protein